MAMTEEEIKALADEMATEILNLIGPHAHKKLPIDVALAIPLGAAAALFVAYGRDRADAIAMLTAAFDVMEQPSENEMDKGQLDMGDRRNLYKEDASNLMVIEADITEITAMLDEDIFDEELVTALDEMSADVRNQRTKIAYVVIKITG